MLKKIVSLLVCILLLSSCNSSNDLNNQEIENKIVSATIESEEDTEIPIVEEDKPLVQNPISPSYSLSTLLDNNPASYSYTEKTIQYYSEDSVELYKALFPDSNDNPSEPFDKIDIDLKYPQFYGFENQEIEIKLNETIAQHFIDTQSSTFNNFEEDYSTYFFRKNNYHIAYSSEKVISILFEGSYLSIAGTRIQPFDFTITMDLETGEFISLNDIFIIDDNFAQTVFKNKYANYMLTENSFLSPEPMEEIFPLLKINDDFYDEDSYYLDNQTRTTNVVQSMSQRYEDYYFCLSQESEIVYLNIFTKIPPNGYLGFFFRVPLEDVQDFYH